MRGTVSSLESVQSLRLLSCFGGIQTVGLEILDEMIPHDVGFSPKVAPEFISRRNSASLKCRDWNSGSSSGKRGTRDTKLQSSPEGILTQFY